MASHNHDVEHGNTPAIRDLRVGSEVCSHGRRGYIESLTDTGAVIQFDDGGMRWFSIPGNFANGTVRIVKYSSQPHSKQDAPPRKQKSQAGSQNQDQQGKQQADSPVKAKDLLHHIVESPRYGRGVVVDAKGSDITVVFNKGTKRIRFDATIAIRKKNLIVGPSVKGQGSKRKASKSPQANKGEGAAKKNPKPRKNKQKGRAKVVREHIPKHRASTHIRSKANLSDSPWKQASTAETSNAPARQAPSNQEQPSPIDKMHSGAVSSIVRKCSNCRYSKNPEKCGHGLLGPCDDWVEATFIKDYWPSWDDMKRANREDLRARYRDRW